MNIFNWKWQTSWYHDTNTHNYDIVKHPRFPKINFQTVSKLGQFGLTATFGSKPFQQILGWRVWFSTFDLKSNQCKWSRKCETVFFSHRNIMVCAHAISERSFPFKLKKKAKTKKWSMVWQGELLRVEIGLTGIILHPSMIYNVHNVHNVQCIQCTQCTQCTMYNVYNVHNVH